LEFYILDVFAEERYAGNQLAVFRNAGHLTKEAKQRIAAEINFAESAFILSEELINGRFSVEIFTPESEVPFAGHPTLGTAFIIQQFMLKAEPTIRQITLNLKIGPVPVEFQYEQHTLGSLFMQQINPTFGASVQPDEIAAALGLDVEDIRTDLPIQEVSTGLPYLIVPLKKLAGIQKMDVQKEAWFGFLIRHQLYRTQRHDDLTVSCYAFCPEASLPHNDLHARMFGYENQRVVEDAATGSANGCLLAYLLKHQYNGQTNLTLRVEQGYEMKRPSLIQLAGQLVGEQMVIKVGGKVQLIASGQWH
jgi:trans-2,3-dihydro-3-hydroxyanthranilate isomerase